MQKLEPLKMKTTDEILKMKAATLYVVNQFPDGVDYIKLFKILYFAQQQHLVKYGRGIIEDTFHALKYGPVPAFIYKALQIKEGRLDNNDDFQDFLQGFAVRNKLVNAIQKPDLDELSTTDIRCLEEAIHNYGSLASAHLSEISHDAAWQSAYDRSEDDPEKDRMSHIEIARAGGASEGMISYIRESQRLDKLLAS